MKLRVLTRRPLWLLALPLLSLPHSAARAQDAPPAPVTQPGAQPGAPDDAAPAEGIDPNTIDPGAPVDTPVDVPASTEPEQKPIDTLEFAAYSQLLGGASQLELDLNKATLPEVAAAIEKASGLRVEVSPQWEAYPDSRITAKVAKTSLWDGLGQLKARGVDAQWIGPTRSLQLLPLADVAQAKVPPRNPLSQDLGGASLGVTRVQRTRALLFPATTEGGDKSDRFELELALRPDPRWRTIDGTASWAGLTLIDAKGKAHAVLSDSAGGTVEGAQAAFDAKSIDTSGPVSIKGELRFAVVAKSQKWSLSDLSKPAKLDIQREGAPVRYEYLGASDASGNLTLKFAASNAADVPGSVVALPSPDPNAPSANLPLYHFAGVGSSGGLRLMGADGASVDFLEAGSGLQSTERSEFEVQAVPNPTTGQSIAPTKAEVDVPLEWREVRVPFEIKNIPLP
jgi:hypothetical protein